MSVRSATAPLEAQMRTGAPGEELPLEPEGIRAGMR